MSNPDGDGGTIAIQPAGALCVVDPPHDWDAARTQWDGGANDGFVVAHRAANGDAVEPSVMAYLARAQQPFTWALADAYASCDRWFSSVLGPTWPNRMYLHSGQSGGITRNTLPDSGALDWTSIWHRLEAAGVSWAYYFNDLPFVPLWKDLPVEGRVRRMAPDFFDDAAAGALPEVVFVDPAFTANDDHPPHHPMLGQQLLASLYAALAASPQWPGSLFTVTYDEHGGFFDHVAPPTAPDARTAEGFGQLGFRVPAIVAGSQVKPGHVSSVVRDHTSVLAHLIRRHGLEPLTARDAAANDLSELIDEDAPPRDPVAMPAIEIDATTLPDACWSSSRRVPTDLERLADRGFFPRGLDRRGDPRDHLAAVGDALDRLGAGRLKLP
jgi:phospholipase C